ncbi:hypothetical protein V6Z12_D02G149500 [Gossypium hirsutum]
MTGPSATDLNIKITRGRLASSQNLLYLLWNILKQERRLYKYRSWLKRKRFSPFTPFQVKEGKKVDMKRGDDRRKSQRSWHIFPSQYSPTYVSRYGARS